MFLIADGTDVRGRGHRLPARRPVAPHVRHRRHYVEPDASADDQRGLTGTDGGVADAGGGRYPRNTEPMGPPAVGGTGHRDAPRVVDVPTRVRPRHPAVAGALPPRPA